MSLPRPTRPIKADTSSSLATRARPDQLRPSDVFRFDPKPGITSDELAELISVFFEIDLHFDRFAKLSQLLQRHFRHLKSA